MHIFHTFMYATPFDTGVGVANEYVMPMFTQDIDNTVMDYPVRIERSNHYHPLFRLMYDLDTILTRHVCFIPQHIVEVGQVFVQIIIETLYFCTIALAFLGVVLRTYDIGVLIEQGINVSEFLCGRNENLSCVSNVVAYIFKILIEDGRIIVILSLRLAFFHL